MLAMQLAFIVSSLSSAPPSLGAAPVQSASAFVDSIGVNTHIGYTGTPYYRLRRVEHALEQLGVDHIRDGIAPGRPDLDARYRALAARGIKLDALIGDPGGENSIQQQLSVIEKQIGPGVVESVEGPNEFDNAGVSNWAPLVRNWVKRLWHDVGERPSLRELPILGPSLVDADSRPELGDISAWTTYGNMHPYPGGNPPDETEHLDSELSLAAINTPGQQVQATETGYTTAINSTDNQPPVSERAAGTYMPRLLLENFRRGIARTYIYELIDIRADAGMDEGAAGFGLLRYDFKPKPAFTAIQNLTSLLSGPAPRDPLQPLEYSLENPPAETRQVLLQKRDGNYFLALWNPVSVWDLETGVGWTPPALPATLRLTEPAGVSIYEPNRSREPVAELGETAEAQIPIGPEVTIVEVRPPKSRP